MSKSQRRTIAVACLLVILLAGVGVNVRLWKTDTHYEDIFWAWGEGERLVKGENSYVRILAASLPFIARNAEGLVKSELFSITREPADDLRLASLDAWMGWLGWPGRLPMFALLMLTYALAWRRKVGLYTGPLLVMATFVGFNTVFFRQYVAWIIPLLPLAMCDLWDAAKGKAAGPA
jgi:hypothetical protein